VSEQLPDVKQLHQLWGEQEWACYNLGIQTEREHQNALSRLAMEKHKAEHDALVQRIAELERIYDTQRSELVDKQRYILQLEAELSERDKSFELRQASDMRAIDMWQEAAGEELQWPNHADLCVWLMERNAYLEDKVRDLNTELQAYTNAYNKTLPPGSTRTRRKGGSHE
jgi:hypothetical protein